MKEFDTTLHRIRMNHNRRVMARLRRKYPTSNEVIQMEGEMLTAYQEMELNTAETAQPDVHSTSQGPGPL